MEELGWNKHNLRERPAFISSFHHRTAHFLQQHQLNFNKPAVINPLLDEDHKCGLSDKELVDFRFRSVCSKKRGTFKGDKNRF